MSLVDGDTDTVMSDASGLYHKFGIEASPHASDQGDGEDWQSEIGHEEFIDSEPEDEVPFRLVGAATARTAFRSIQSVNLVETFQERASVMKSVPRFLRGPFRIAMRCAIEEIMAGVRSQNVDREENGWRLFLSLPRMLLPKPARGGRIP